MKKVLFFAAVAICAMGCCKKADNKCCKAQEEAAPVEQVAEEAPVEEAPAEQVVEAPADAQ
jgi:hypothetical protein